MRALAGLPRRLPLPRLSERLAVPWWPILACFAERARSARMTHVRAAFLACSGRTETVCLRCCTGTVCLYGSRPLCDVPVHMLVESECYIRMHSDRECIFHEYLRRVAVCEEHAVARARAHR